MFNQFHPSRNGANIIHKQNKNKNKNLFVVVVVVVE
jgi:hypothetical protein